MTATGAPLLVDFDDTLVSSTGRRVLFVDTMRAHGLDETAIETVMHRSGRAFQDLFDGFWADPDFELFLETYAAALEISQPVLCRGASRLLSGATVTQPISIVSSSHTRLVRAELKALGVDPSQLLLFGSDRTMFSKPDPRVLTIPGRALNQLGFRLSQAILIGDSLDDMECAVEQCAFWAVTSGRTSAADFLSGGVAPEHVFDSLDAIADQLGIEPVQGPPC